MGFMSGTVAVAAVPGITGDSGLATAPGATTTFNLTARAGSISQPDGAALYSWGYGCTLSTSTGFAPAKLSAIANCPEFQVPAPTLIVREGTVVTVNLTNHLPAPAGNTSIVFSGMQVNSQVTNVQTVTSTPTVPDSAGSTLTVSTDPTYANVSVVYGAAATLPAVAGALVTGYTVVGGTYTFVAGDAGQPVVISGTTTVAAVTNPLTATVPLPNPVVTSPFTYVASTDSTYADGGVVNSTTLSPLTLDQTTIPLGAGTYSYAAGVYTFSDADAGITVVVSGTTTTGAVTTPVTFNNTVPQAAGVTVVASTIPGYANVSVVYGTGATPATLGGKTVPGYTVSGGTYTFLATDARQPVVITGTAPITTTTGASGLLTQEAAPGGTVKYTFTASKPGTYAYYSGTQPELQIEMGMYGALIVLPNAAMDSDAADLAAGCPASGRLGTTDARLAHFAYDHPQTCYDREYLFQFSEADSRIHRAAEDQVLACAAALATTPAGTCAPAVVVNTEPYVPNYFLVNGRSMPDLMDGNYIPTLPNQPYNGNPHIRPGEMLLMRTIGQGRVQHPFHIHGDHARTLARDGNLLVAQIDSAPLNNASGVAPAKVNRLAGPLIFTVPTVSGQSIDGIFSWSGKGLNWDVYGPTNHTCNGKSFPGYNGVTALPTPVAMEDAASYGAYLTAVTAITSTTTSPGIDGTTGENCADHGKPIPVMPPDPQIVANGLWYSGTPYLGVQTIGSAFASTPLPPGLALQNTSAGYAYMWHSHDEREITTNDVFPGGMMMMLIIDPPGAPVDESK
jgi:FtsP/CotA-like multicopper oxidase with cupredoxin domain